MSTYYDYYLGIKKEDGKVYPIGPYTKDGHLVSIYSTQGSFDSIHQEFWDLGLTSVSEELFEKFKVAGWDDEDHLDLMYIPLKDIYDRVQDGGIKFGYVPTKLITMQEAYKANSYDNESVADELTYKAISPIEYAALSEKNREKYAYYAWKDTESASYQAARIAAMATEFVSQLIGTDDDSDVVVLANVC